MHKTMISDTKDFAQDALLKLRILRVNGVGIPDDVWKSITETIKVLEGWTER